MREEKPPRATWALPGCSPRGEYLPCEEWERRRGGTQGQHRRRGQQRPRRRAARSVQQQQQAACRSRRADRTERRSGERREGLTQSEGVRVPGEGVEGGTADWCRGDQLLQTQVAGTEERWTVKGTILFVVGSAKKTEIQKLKLRKCRAFFGDFPGWQQNAPEISP